MKSRGGKSQRREEKKEDQGREAVRRPRTQVREKVAKSRNTVFFEWFVAPEGRKVGSLKRRVRSHVVRWEMKTALVARSTFGSQNESKCTKHTRVGPLFEVEMSKKCTPLWPGMGEERRPRGYLQRNQLRRRDWQRCGKRSQWRGLPPGEWEHAQEWHRQSRARGLDAEPKNECCTRGPMMRRTTCSRSQYAESMAQALLRLPNGASFNWPKCSKCFQVSAKEADLSEASSLGKRRKMVWSFLQALKLEIFFVLSLQWCGVHTNARNGFHWCMWSSISCRAEIQIDVRNR